MTSKLDQYLDHLADALELRHRGNEAGEESVSEQMDTLWYQLSANERDLVNGIGARLASGALTETEFIRQRRRQVA